MIRDVRSWRKLAAACRDQIPYWWLTGWRHPDPKALWRFYKDYRQAMRSPFKHTAQTAVAMELVDVALQAVDRTRVTACAAGDRSYDAEGLSCLPERVEKSILDLEAQNQAVGETAASRLPGELADKRVLRRWVRQAMDDLTNQEVLRLVDLTDIDARMMKRVRALCPATTVRQWSHPSIQTKERQGC